MPCKLGVCNQADCFCGTVIHTKKCPRHPQQSLVVEAHPLYNRTDVAINAGKEKNDVKMYAKLKIFNWWYVLVCPIKGCTVARPWKNGPKNKKRKV